MNMLGDFAYLLGEFMNMLGELVNMLGEFVNVFCVSVKILGEFGLAHGGHTRLVRVC